MGWPRGGVPQPYRVVVLPEAMRVPSGLNATVVTPPVVAGKRPADGSAAGRRPTAALLSSCRWRCGAVGAERHARHRLQACHGLEHVPLLHSAS